MRKKICKSCNRVIKKGTCAYCYSILMEQIKAEKIQHHEESKQYLITLVREQHDIQK